MQDDQRRPILTVSPPRAALLSFALSALLAPVVLWFLRRRRILDVPTPRSSHVVPTPRGGGLALAIGCLAGVLVSNQLTPETRDTLLLIGVGVGVIGLLDDVLSLAAWPRLAAQLAVAATGSLVLAHRAQLVVALQIFLPIIMTLWIVTYVNAFNFMDGINGISIAQVFCAGIFWYLLGQTVHAPELSAIALIGAASACSFAPFNLLRAAMFLGDVGSYFFGAWLAIGLLIAIHSKVPPEVALAPLALYLLDVGLTLARRMLRREPWYRPHREHTYQRLVESGWSHLQTSGLVAAAILLTCALSSLSLTGSLPLRICGDCLAIFVLVAYVALPHEIHRRREHRPSMTFIS